MSPAGGFAQNAKCYDIFIYSESFAAFYIVLLRLSDIDL